MIVTARRRRADRASPRPSRGRAGRPRDRGAGGRRGGVPGFAARGRPPAADDAHDRRRHRGRRPGDITFAHITELVDEIVTVDEEAISRALLTARTGKLVVEPAGAAAVAALLSAAAVRRRRWWRCSPAATSIRC